MLSRVADSLYWMSRYLERAEHTARLLDLNAHWLLDQKPESITRRWDRVVQSLGLDGAVAAPADPLSISRRLTFDAAEPGSIVACINAARRNAREVREQISSEMWEQLNRLYLRVQHTDAEAAWEGQVHDFFKAIKEGSHLFQGITDATMSHDEGWQFIQLGRSIERVSATVNLLEVHFRDYGEAQESPLLADDYLEWVGLLKSCTAFEAYCRVYTVNVQPRHVAEFLLLDQAFPHSVRFGVNMMRSALDAIAEATETTRRGGAYRLAGRLASELSYDQIDEILPRGLMAYLAGVREQCRQIHAEIHNTCIAYPIEAAL